MSVKTAIQPIVVRAQQAGIRLPLSKLRDAICLALYRKTFSPLVAAESAGQTFAPSMDAAAIPAIAAEYRINAQTFATALGVAAATVAAPEPDDGLTFPAALKDQLFGGPRPLFAQYDGQLQPQRAYIELDEDGNINADYSGGIGNAVPISVWNGCTLRFRVPHSVNGRELWDYITGEGRPLLARIHAGHEVDWDGNNWRGTLTDDAREAKEALELALESLLTDYAATVDEWIYPNRLIEVWPIGQSLEDAANELHDSLPRFDGRPEEMCVEGDLDDCRAALIKKAGYERNANLDRWHARQLVAHGEWTIVSYAEWVADYSDSADDPQEAALDDQYLAPLALWINDSGAPTDAIERGVLAATDELSRRAISPLRAFIAASIDANNGNPIADDLDAWSAAEAAALDAAFAGWARRPEGASLGMA